MATTINNTEKKGIASLQNLAAIVVLFILSATSQLMAQGPSLGNLKKSLHDIKADQERIAHDEFMGYVYMILGFSVVIGIAWSTTVMTRNRNRKELEKKQAYLARQMEMKKHGHVHHRPRR